MTILHRTAALVLILAGAAASSNAQADMARVPTAMIFASGTCDALTVGGKTVECGGSVFSIVYSDGRRSLAVKAADGLVSFFGHADNGDLVVEMVTGIRPGDDGKDTRTVSEPATGRCTPAKLAPKTRFICSATSEDGHAFALTFITDDKPVSENRMDK